MTCTRNTDHDFPCLECEKTRETERDRIRAIVDERLKELGLIGDIEAFATNVKHCPQGPSSVALPGLGRRRHRLIPTEQAE